MLRHVRLDDDDRALRVDAARQVHVGHVHGVAAQLGALLTDGDGVQVDDAVDAVVRLLHGDVVADRAEVVAQVQGAGRLGAAEDTRAAGRRSFAGRPLRGVGVLTHEP